jgi:hypothetical protein
MLDSGRGIEEEEEEEAVIDDLLADLAAPSPELGVGSR